MRRAGRRPVRRDVRVAEIAVRGARPPEELAVCDQELVDATVRGDGRTPHESVGAAELDEGPRLETARRAQQEVLVRGPRDEGVRLRECRGGSPGLVVGGRVEE